MIDDETSIDDEISESGGIVYGDNKNPMYMCLYSDGEMIISPTKINPESGRKVLVNKKDHGPRALDKKLTLSIKTITFTGKIKLTTPCYFFGGLKNLQKINNIENLDVSDCKVFGYMFTECNSLESVELNKLDTSKAISFIYMFNDCTNLKRVDTDKMNTSNVKYMDTCFKGCESLEKIDLSGWNTSKTIDMSELFQGCKSLKEINVRSLDTSKLEDMRSMFSGCSSLTSLNIKNFNTSKVRFMAGLFSGCENLETLDLSNFNTNCVWTVEGMFEDCEALKKLDLSRFNLKGASYYRMDDMFKNCNSLNSVIATEATKYDICQTPKSGFENIKNWIITD